MLSMATNAEHEMRGGDLLQSDLPTINWDAEAAGVDHPRPACNRRPDGQDCSGCRFLPTSDEINI
jgi:hypothetical protein